MTATFSQQDMTSAMGKARYLWTTFARRAQSSTALSAAAQAFLALSYEMEAYEQYRVIQQGEQEDEPIDLHDYERVLISLGAACDAWWKTLRLLQTSSEQTLPAAFANKEALITGCLEQRLRLIEVSVHLLKLQLSCQEMQEMIETAPAQKGEEQHG
jgi:hypothetical protein